MILVDTSVWVDHLRRLNPRLRSALLDGEVLGHPFVFGELALGRLSRRAEILALLSDLPQAPMATHAEALALVERHALAGAGIGWVDTHLLASAKLGRAPLWTLDRQLHAVAARMGLAA